MSFFANNESINGQWVQLLMKAGFGLLLVLTVLFIVMTINQIQKSQFIGEAADIQNTITVRGTGEATAVPDSAQFSVGVTNTAESVDTAQTQSTKAINTIIDYLQSEGVAEESIRTTSYNVSPQYAQQQRFSRARQDNREVVGYEVSQRLEVTVDDTEKAGELLSGVGERGADSVSQLSFVVSDDDKLQRQARTDAITDARESAQELANALGVQLGDVVSYSQAGNVRPMIEQQEAFDAAGSAGDTASPQVPTGENSVRTQASVTFEIN